jgi:metal-responsive CopG/Arc/MetJ family transcriptional regulator
MKTAVSLPDVVFREAEKFARQHRKSRSKLYTDAIVEYLERHAPESITDSMNRVMEKVGPEDNAFAKAASGLVLGREEW